MIQHIMTAKMCKLAFSCYSNWIPASNWLLHSCVKGKVAENSTLITSSRFYRVLTMVYNT
jgi:hypothetical protein